VLLASESSLMSGRLAQGPVDNLVSETLRSGVT
jgi:hypothetical protein